MTAAEAEKLRASRPESSGPEVTRTGCLKLTLYLSILAALGGVILGIDSKRESSNIPVSPARETLLGISGTPIGDLLANLGDIRTDSETDEPYLTTPCNTGYQPGSLRWDISTDANGNLVFSGTRGTYVIVQNGDSVGISFYSNEGSGDGNEDCRSNHPWLIPGGRR